MESALLKLNEEKWLHKNDTTKQFLCILHSLHRKLIKMGNKTLQHIEMYIFCEGRDRENEINQRKRERENKYYFLSICDTLSKRE